MFFSLTEAPLNDPTPTPPNTPKQTRNGPKRTQTDPKQTETDPKGTEIKLSGVERPEVLSGLGGVRVVRGREHHYVPN